ncbi:hypothetical protein AV530_017044 [Patagioenas fasciata monilis]|uniref:Uncharacterized protein n=2 Tax=Patagioenas fasciata monilis TaxID=372326 RepID=A0A1V4J4H8_PATFA|nr:hypothetical protein AV530_017044 [Patagioenas fasciata monilis]
MERQHGIGREAGIFMKGSQVQFWCVKEQVLFSLLLLPHGRTLVSLIVLEPAFWDNYQIIYSSKLLNGTEALWIVGHMMRKFSCLSRLLLPDSSPSVSRG